jgi:very-short-patch-repair endonuclease
VAFVPLQYWKYKWLAIQLDGAHSEEQATDDAGRDEYVRRHKFEVMSLKPNERGYLEEVRTLVEQLESWMTLAETRPWEIAVEAQVRRTVNDSDVPF